MHAGPSIRSMRKRARGRSQCACAWTSSHAVALRRTVAAISSSSSLICKCAALRWDMYLPPPRRRVKRVRLPTRRCTHSTCKSAASIKHASACGGASGAAWGYPTRLLNDKTTSDRHSGSRPRSHGNLCNGSGKTPQTLGARAPATDEGFAEKYSHSAIQNSKVYRVRFVYLIGVNRPKNTLQFRVVNLFSAGLEQRFGSVYD